MDDLIEALQILLKYGNPEYPTNCTHDEVRIMEIDPDNVSQEDSQKLETVGLDVAEDLGDKYFYSFRFGSA